MANARGVATIGMKVMGFGALAHVYDKALRYSMSLPVSTVIVGCSTMEELTKDLAVAEAFMPLSGRERLDLFARSCRWYSRELALEGQRLGSPHGLAKRVASHRTHASGHIDTRGRRFPLLQKSAAPLRLVARASHACLAAELMSASSLVRDPRPLRPDCPQECAALLIGQLLPTDPRRPNP